MVHEPIIEEKASSPVEPVELKLSKKQAEFIEAVKSGKNIFLTGKAGTGKSHVVLHAIDLLKKGGKKVVALAPTGIAANNIKGQTMHSFFSLDPFAVLTYELCRFLKSEKRRLLESIDTIVIDEISMLRPDVLDAINWTLIKNGCDGLKSIQIIFVGDLKQLEAPIDDNMRSVLLGIYKGTEFYDAKIYARLDVQTIELDEILRQSDPEFITALNIIRDGRKAEYFRQFVGTELRGVVLAPHNSTVTAYNVKGLAGIDGEEHVFEAHISGNVKYSDFNVEPRIKVKDGARIMYLANSKNNNLVNGTLGVFRARDGVFFIDVKGVEYALDPIEFTKCEYVLNENEDKLELRELGTISQVPIKLAYALTIHKSQGLTFDEVTVDLTLKCFSRGQLYVALSRVTSPAGLVIIGRR